MEKKYKIGYTTGAFDLFHVGHLRILQRAKEQCDYLYVGVSTDELILDYKGSKPFVPFEERMEILKAIKYVDEVIPQENMDKYEMWKKISYNVLFHGSDWKGSSMYNEIEKKLNEKGVDVIYFEHTDGISSTMIKERLNKR